MIHEFEAQCIQTALHASDWIILDWSTRNEHRSSLGIERLAWICVGSGTWNYRPSPQRIKCESSEMNAECRRNLFNLPWFFHLAPHRTIKHNEYIPKSQRLIFFSFSRWISFIFDLEPQCVSHPIRISFNFQNGKSSVSRSILCATICLCLSVVVVSFCPAHRSMTRGEQRPKCHISHSKLREALYYCLLDNLTVNLHTGTGYVCAPSFLLSINGRKTATTIDPRPKQKSCSLIKLNGTHTHTHHTQCEWCASQTDTDDADFPSIQRHLFD